MKMMTRIFVLFLLIFSLTACGGPTEAEIAAQKADEEAKAHAAALPVYDPALLYEWVLADLDARPEENTHEIRDTFATQEDAQAFLAAVSDDMDAILRDHYLPGLAIKTVSFSVSSDRYNSSFVMQYDWSEDHSDLTPYLRGGPFDRGGWSEDALETFVRSCIEEKTDSATALFFENEAAGGPLPDESTLLSQTEGLIYQSEYGCFYVDRYHVKTQAFGDAVFVYLDLFFNENKDVEIFDLPEDMSDIELIELLIDREVSWNRPICLRCASDRDEEALSFLTEIAVVNDCRDLAAQPDMRYASTYAGAYGKKIVELSFTFTPGTEDSVQERTVMDEAIDRGAAEVAELSAGMPPEGIYRAVSDYVCKKCEYDMDLALSVEHGLLTAEEAFNSSAYGALITGKTICSGYAAAFKAICDTMGLPCWIVTGKVTDEYGDRVDHAWNAVLIEGGIFYVDPTFLDQNAESSYFLFRELSDHEREIDENWILPW